VSLHIAPDDARRGGLIILGAGAEDGPSLARRYAEGGYETIVAEAGDQPESLIGALAPPVFVLAFPDAAQTAWVLSGAAAASVIGDGRAASLVDTPPATASILHLDPSSHHDLSDAFERAQPDLPVHSLRSADDGDRMFFLRTLRLFSANAGGPGEV